MSLCFILFFYLTMMILDNQRFGGERIRVYLATLALILYVFTKISVR